MIAPKRLRNSRTITPESMFFGGRMAVTAEPGESAAKISSPSSRAATRIDLANSWALSMSFGRPMPLTYFNDSASARIREVAGVQLDSPFSPLFFSFLKREEPLNLLEFLKSFTHAHMHGSIDILEILFDLVTLVLTIQCTRTNPSIQKGVLFKNVRKLTYILSVAQCIISISELFHY